MTLPRAVFMEPDSMQFTVVIRAGLTYKRGFDCEWRNVRECGSEMCNQFLNMFQPIASAVTLVIAFAVAVIAFFQFKVAHDRLRLDLFDRRYKIYDATRRFLSVILTNATFQDSDLFVAYQSAHRHG